MISIADTNMKPLLPEAVLGIEIHMNSPSLPNQKPNLTPDSLTQQYRQTTTLCHYVEYYSVDSNPTQDKWDCSSMHLSQSSFLTTCC